MVLLLKLFVNEKNCHESVLWAQVQNVNVDKNNCVMKLGNLFVWHDFLQRWVSSGRNPNNQAFMFFFLVFNQKKQNYMQNKNLRYESYGFR